MNAINKISELSQQFLIENSKFEFQKLENIWVTNLHFQNS